MDTLLEQATPRPWRYYGPNSPDGDQMYLYGRDGRQFIACTDASEQAEVDLKLAAGAVNAYEPLVKALREIHFSCCSAGKPLTVHQESCVHDGQPWPCPTMRALATVESSPEREGGE